MSNYNLPQLLSETQQYVTDILNSQVPETMTYHNLTHTREVVKAALIIASKSRLNEIDTYWVQIAAWFHDLGHTSAEEDHEKQSQHMAWRFLEAHSIAPPDIERVAGAIEATRMPQKPMELMEEVLCDADLYNLSQRSFYTSSLNLRNEWTHHRQRNFSDREWIAQNLAFLEGHHYFTEYGRKVLQVGKEANKLHMRDMLFSMPGPDDSVAPSESPTPSASPRHPAA